MRKTYSIAGWPARRAAFARPGRNSSPASVSTSGHEAAPTCFAALDVTADL